MYPEWGLNVDWNELQKVLEEQKDPDYWRKQCELERAKNKKLEEDYLSRSVRVCDLQDQVQRLESALAQMWLEFKESERQWEVDWYNAGDFGLIKSLLRGEDVAVPSTGVVRQVYELLRKLTELEG
jgi:hypothetical protein